ncbi:uncharacterized protein DS421_5g136660 [Arachis hypogaea]|nr:uncharacterized protein DS421_5g136660 [Arachis hypogaea]
MTQSGRVSSSLNLQLSKGIIPGPWFLSQLARKLLGASRCFASNTILTVVYKSTSLDLLLRTFPKNLDLILQRHIALLSSQHLSELY